MIQFAIECINNIIEWINIHIQGIAAITTLIFIFLTILNDRYDFTNEKCECGFKNDHLGSKAYWAWIKEQEQLKQKQLKEKQLKEQSDNSPGQKL